jgi:transcriptional regulator
MYEPPLHRVEDAAKLRALIRENPLGLLITSGQQGLLANAMPFLLDADDGVPAKLRTHMARANPQWCDLVEPREALVVFQGPEHYITPSWYETKRETGKVVPTWNYVMVQARGLARATEDDAWLARQIDDLTRSQEETRAAPWAVSDAPADFVAAQRRAIVGVEIEIVDLRGKWKASQNRNAADRAGVVAGLSTDATAGDDAARLMAALVARPLRD